MSKCLATIYIKHIIGGVIHYLSIFGINQTHFWHLKNSTVAFRSGPFGVSRAAIEQVHRMSKMSLKKRESSENVNHVFNSLTRNQIFIETGNRHENNERVAYLQRRDKEK